MQVYFYATSSFAMFAYQAQYENRLAQSNGCRVNCADSSTLSSQQIPFVVLLETFRGARFASAKAIKLSASQASLTTKMNLARRATLSLATFVLICFFLPWVEASCPGMKDSISGYDLARDEGVLWIIPLSMLVVVVAGVASAVVRRLPAAFGLAGTVGGSISAYLMYRERLNTNASPKLVALHWTALFWLAFIASLGVSAAALLFYARRSRSP